MSEPEMVWTDEMYEELFEYAHELFPDAMSLAIDSAEYGDYDAILRLLHIANEKLTERSLSNLIDRGLIEIDGLDETGDWVFALTEKGINYNAKEEL